MRPDLAALALRYVPSLLAALAVSGGLWWAFSHVKELGRAECRAEIEAQAREKQGKLFDLGNEMSRSEVALFNLRQGLDERAREIEDEVRSDDDACRRVGTDSVQRLERRWRDRPEAP